MGEGGDRDGKVAGVCVCVYANIARSTHRERRTERGRTKRENTEEEYKSATELLRTHVRPHCSGAQQPSLHCPPQLLLPPLQREGREELRREREREEQKKGGEK